MSRQKLEGLDQRNVHIDTKTKSKDFSRPHIREHERQQTSFKYESQKDHEPKGISDLMHEKKPAESKESKSSDHSEFCPMHKKILKKSNNNY